MQPSEELRIYIETEIIPRYESFDAAHGTDHVRTVIAHSLDLARHYDVDADMIYAVAAYHDKSVYLVAAQHIVGQTAPLRSLKLLATRGFKYSTALLYYIRYILSTEIDYFI